MTDHTRDWHATYLHDAATMGAARARCAQTGEDGWAAAAVLAPTLPPALGSYEAGRARAVLAPQTEPNAEEEQDLRDHAEWELPPWESTAADPRSVEEWERRDAQRRHKQDLIAQLMMGVREVVVRPNRRMHTASGERPDSFTCPRCGRTSHNNPPDAEHGYCGNCHDWTRLARGGQLVPNGAEGFSFVEIDALWAPGNGVAGLLRAFRAEETGRLEL